MKSTNKIPFLTQKTALMIFDVELFRLNFRSVGETFRYNSFKKRITDQIQQLEGPSIFRNMLSEGLAQFSVSSYELLFLTHSPVREVWILHSHVTTICQVLTLLNSVIYFRKNPGKRLFLSVLQ